MNQQTPPDATVKDYAKFFTLMLSERRQSIADVVAWADVVILTSAAAPGEQAAWRRVPYELVSFYTVAD